MFVGRDRELAELEGAFAKGTSGIGALFLLVGEPGIGKTRFALEAANLARERGHRVSWGRCWEAGGAPTFWPWREALEGLELAFPDVAAIAAGDPGEARFALFREVVGVLSREAARAPLLLVLEDLHAADRSSLQLLELAVTQLRGSRVVVLGTYRDVEASLRAETSDALARIGRAGRVLQLGRLRQDDVTALVRDAIEDADDGLAASVFATTLGNPLFVDELVRDVRTRGTWVGLSIPLGVREIIRQRFSLVSSEARSVLEAGAVLGVEFAASDVARLCAGAGAMLEDATRSGLVTSYRDRVRFSHALYREALYHDLPRARRQELHRQAARALAPSSSRLAETAHHLLESGPEMAAAAIEQAIRAADRALDVFAFDDAMALLERARGVIPNGPLEEELRCRVSVALGEAWVRNGDPAGRARCLEAADAARELGDASLLALAGLAYGAVFTMGGVDPVLVELLVEALARLGEDDSPLRARVMARLAAARQPSLTRDRRRDIELALEAIAMARRVADRRELLGVLHSASGALYGAAPPSVRLPISREQERLAEELDDTTRLVYARVRLAVDHLELADFASYEQLTTSYEALARRLGPAANPWRVPLMRSMQALGTDQFELSKRLQAESRAIESVHPRARRAQAYHRLCHLRAAEHHTEMRAGIAELRGLWLEMPYGAMLAESRVASTLARIGDDGEVRAIVSKLSDDVWGEQINCAALAEAVWSTGDPQQAAKLCPIAAGLGTRWMIYWLDCEIVESPLDRLIAYLQGIMGDWETANRLHARALREVEGVGKRSMAARMRFELGDLMLRLGREPARGRELVAEGRAGASALGLSELVGLIDRRWPLSSPDFAMVLEGEYYAVACARGTLRFKVTRGMQYLARLVAEPGVDVHVLELAGSSELVDRSDAGELLDGAAFRAYRQRVEELRDALEEAEARGDAERAERARGEMEAIAGEIAKATSKGGRARRGESAVDRARSAVQRRIKDALDRIAEQDEALGRKIRRAITTGNHCSYRPSP